MRSLSFIKCHAHLVCHKGFKINYPEGWRINEQGAENMGMVAVFTPDVNAWEVEEQVRNDS